MNRWASLGALLGATVAVSFSAIFIRLSGTTPPLLMGGRLLVTCVLLYPLARRAGERRIVRRDAPAVVLSGLLLGFHFLTWAVALQLTSVASAVLLISLHPLLVAALAPRVLGQPLTRRSVAGLGLGLVGTVVVAAGDRSGASSALLGDALAVIGAAAISGYLLLAARLTARSTASYGFWVYLIAGGLALATTVGDGLRVGHIHVGQPLWREGLLALGLAAVCTIGGHTVYNWSLRHLPATAVSLGFLGEPVFTTLLAFLILAGHPVPALTAVVGGVVALVGVVVAVPGRPPVTEPAG